MLFNKIIFFKNGFGLYTVIFLTLISFLSATCDNKNDLEDKLAGSNPVILVNPIGPSVPEPMSDKNAMLYFMDYGIRIGWNMGNTLDAVNTWSYKTPRSEETAWGNPRATQELFNGIKDLGFDIVRIPITWTGRSGAAPYYQIEEDWLLRVAEIVGYARNAGLKVIINMHHDDSTNYGWLLIGNAVTSASEKIKITDKFVKLWMQIAGYFRNYGDWLIFESMNEVQDGGWGWSYPFRANPKAQLDIVNEWNQKFTDTVRASGGNNELRFLMYPSYASGSEAILPDGSIGWGPAANQRWDVGKYFKIPKDSVSGRQIVTFHYYDPEPFHNGVNPEWGSPAEKAAVDNLFVRFKTTFIDRNIPVIIGEMGPKRTSGKLDDGTNMSPLQIAAAKASRINWVEYVFAKAREVNMIPVYWDNGAYRAAEYSRDQFGIINRTTGQPNSDESRELIQVMMTAAGK
jgi:endoglucanase